jgi:hypothetical protein
MKLYKSDSELSISYINNTKFSTIDIYYYKLFKKFFLTCSEEQINIIIDILSGKSKISLRMLDWFVTRYCDINIILIDISKENINKSSNIDDLINIYINYKAQLKSHTKKYFDLFKRQNHLKFTFENFNKTIETTLGQLNFFKWLFENKILDFVLKNYDHLSEEMKISGLNDIKNKIGKKVKKINNKQKNITINMDDMINDGKNIIMIFD